MHAKIYDFSSICFLKFIRLTRILLSSHRYTAKQFFKGAFLLDDQDQDQDKRFKITRIMPGASKEPMNPGPE